MSSPIAEAGNKNEDSNISSRWLAAHRLLCCSKLSNISIDEMAAPKSFAFFARRSACSITQKEVVWQLTTSLLAHTCKVFLVFHLLVLSNYRISHSKTILTLNEASKRRPGWVINCTHAFNFTYQRSTTLTWRGHNSDGIICDTKKQSVDDKLSAAADSHKSSDESWPQSHWQGNYFNPETSQ